MRVVEKVLNGLLVIEPRVFTDSRGLFFESFNQNLFNDISGVKANFSQDNHSVSKKDVIRGLHLQAPPNEQGKLVRVSAGKVYDVAVDVRVGSPTFGKSFGLELSSQNNLMLWIPPGFAHGFSVLENNTVFLYKCTNVYNKDSEMTLLYNDPEIKIDWKVNEPIVSDKDKEGISYSNFKSPFKYI
jgi:dTDP-4-dehydrorhamnose 3,5-epimerase